VWYIARVLTEEKRNRQPRPEASDRQQPPPSYSSQNLKRTNVRLPYSVHQALKQAALDRNLSIEQIVLAAVEKELACSGTAAALRSSSDSKVLGKALRDLNQTVAAIQEYLEDGRRVFPVQFAKRYLEALPLPANIKRLPEMTIVWCNPAYASLLEMSQAQLVGKRVTDLSPHVEFDSMQRHHTREASMGPAHVALERVRIGGKLVEYVPHRFRFSVGGFDYLGDVTLLVEDMERSSIKPWVYPPIRKDDSLHMGEHQLNVLLGAFLQNVETSAVLQRPDGRILWCNETFLLLTGSTNLEEILNLTSAQVFNLSPEHPTVQYDSRVAAEGIALLGSQEIGGAKRSVAHFAIEGNDSIEFVGVMSCETAEIRESRNKRKAELSKPVSPGRGR
jgi:PAS domain-containing protein